MIRALRLKRSCLSLGKVWSEVTDATACLFGGLQNGVTGNSELFRQASQTWHDVSCPLIKQLLCGGVLYSRYRRTKLATAARCLSCFCLFFFPFLTSSFKRVTLKEPRIVARHSSSSYCHFSVNRNAKAGKRETTTFQLLLPDTSFFVCAHSFISPQSSKVGVARTLWTLFRLGYVSTLVLAFG